MNNKDHNQTLHDKILQSIKNGEVKMRPKWHFILRGALVVVGLLLLALTLLYIASFIFFILRQNGTWFVPSFGFQGLGVLLYSLPWLLIGITIIFIVILEILVQRFSFGYRKPLLYSALAVILFVIVGGFVLAQTPLHSRFYQNARQGHLPIAGQFYRNYGMPHLRDVHPCIITEITDDGFDATDPRDESVHVIITPDTKFPLGTNFTVGDRVLVLGQRASSTINAVGIRKIDADGFHHIPPPPGTSTPHIHPQFQ